MTERRATMLHTMSIAFRGNVSVSVGVDGIVLASPRAGFRLDASTPGLTAVVQVMAAEGASEDRLAEIVHESDGPAALAPLYYQLRRWGERALLRYTLALDGVSLLAIEPMAEGWRFEPPQFDPAARFRLSRFASIRWADEALVLDSPLSAVRVTLHGTMAAALLAALAQPTTCATLCQVAEQLGQPLSPDAAAAFVGLLVASRVVGEIDADGRLAEDRAEDLRQWEPHDLAFHARARLGRHDDPAGATYRFVGAIAPLPALKPTMPGVQIPLAVPDLDGLRECDITLTAVIEDRRSIRAYGSQPISAGQLGELLYRVARVRKLGAVPPPDCERYQISSRPYPSGGAVYDLELYAVVNRCAGLDAGLYHFDPGQHAVTRIADLSAQCLELLRDAEDAAALECPAQVLLIVSSRFQRASWKYSSSAYALVLKNVGALYQTIYLVATAMGLAPCALGNGNSDLFAEAVGLDYFTETSVGEFLLGSAP